MFWLFSWMNGCFKTSHSGRNAVGGWNSVEASFEGLSKALILPLH